MAAAISGGSLAAPDDARRTVANASAGASVKWANAAHIDGAPGIDGDPRLRIDSSAVSGSNRCTSSSVAPAASVRPSMTFKPKMWNIGNTPYTTSSSCMVSTDERA